VFKRKTSYLFPLTLLICLVVLSSSFFGLRRASVNGSLYIEDIKGDRSVLDDVIISGVLQDRSHGLSFEICNDKVDKQFLYYQSNEAIATMMSSLGNTFYQGGISYSYHTDYLFSPKANTEILTEVHKDENGAEYKEITRTSNMADVYIQMHLIDHEGKKARWERINFSPGAYIKSDKQIFEISERHYYNQEGSLISRSGGSASITSQVYAETMSISDPSNAFTMLKGSIYFTLLSTPQYKGTNGIYKVEQFTSDWMSQLDDRSQYGQIKTITSFSLDEQNLNVLGLKAVDNKLVLILLEDDTLKIRSYHPENGNLIDQLEVAHLTSHELRGPYGCYIDGNRLNLSIPRAKESSSQNSDTDLLVSLRIDDDITLLHLVEGLDLEAGEKVAYNLDQIYEVNGKLFVFTYLSEEGLELNSAPYSSLSLEPKHYAVFVYQNGRLLYKGKFIDDSDQDYIANRLKVQSFDSINTDYYQYRSIRGIRVRGR